MADQLRAAASCTVSRPDLDFGRSDLEDSSTDHDHHQKHAVAQETIGGLKDLLEQRQRALTKTRELLAAAHATTSEERETHLQEIQRLSQRVTSLTDENARLNHAQLLSVQQQERQQRQEKEKPQQQEQEQLPSGVDRLVDHLKELEARNSEQEHQIISLTHKLSAALARSTEVQHEKETMRVEHATREKELRSQLCRLQEAEAALKVELRLAQAQAAEATKLLPSNRHDLGSKATRAAFGSTEQHDALSQPALLLEQGPRLPVTAGAVVDQSGMSGGNGGGVGAAAPEADSAASRRRELQATTLAQVDGLQQRVQMLKAS